MGMPSAAAVGSLSKDVAWYRKDLPSDISEMRKVLEEYSGIPPDSVDKHVKEVRDKAWEVYPYGSVGMFGFLSLNMPNFKVFPEILERVKSGEKLLDIGCCFAQELRLLAYHGAPSENLLGADLHGGFMDVGYDLFLDRNKLKSRFIVADLFDETSSLYEWNGAMDIIHASSFFHLFSWEQQVAACKRCVQLLRPRSGSLIVGRQAGNINAGEYARDGGRGSRYRHDATSWARLWEQVGDETNSKWKVDASLEMEGYFEAEGRFADWQKDTSRRLVFCVRREE
ncbi:hypothetical protein BP5796_13029 [Coleophoma crateriformis]|uniref:Methyltransferase domain-containing protein n=1 Tax=Coleophoma crateriformis TaxID=565419 RepID=A0A3D8Q579_9HELO|nr:hypothetical protein BP5796_13029 [Coleophoma crateriformis]